MARPDRPRPVSRLTAFGRRVEARILVLVLTATAGVIALVALSYALYALLLMRITPAAASAVTAAIYSVLFAGMAIVVPRLLSRKRARREAAQLDHKPGSLSLLYELGLVLLTSQGDRRPVDRASRR